MNDDKLYALYVSEDGDVSLHTIDDFNAWYKKDFDGCTPPVFKDALPAGGYHSGSNGRGGWYLLIRGKIVVPRAETVVTKYTVDP